MPASSASTLVNTPVAALDAERALRLAEEQIAVVSHELRTPLSAILNWVQLLQKFPADQEAVKRSAAAIERSVRMQAQLVNDLLDVSRMARGKIELTKKRCAVDDVIRTSLKAVEDAARAKRIIVDYVGSPDMFVLTDELRLHQVIVNLLGNAIRFTPAEGRVSITVRKDRGYGVIAVTDTGRGIKPDLLPHVFDRWFQADGTSRGATGLGLGLYIVKQIVEMSGGTVQAHSAGPEKGATFTVRLPASAVRLS
jgi:signal transduction histidine kinase